MRNDLKKYLKSGKVAFGTFMATSQAEFVEILGMVGFDFVVFDLEHGPMSVESTVDLIRAAELRGLVPITRVTKNEEARILRSLDVGSYGIQIPQVNTVSDATKVVEFTKYAPIGKRGVAIPRAIDFGMTNLLDSYRITNDESLVIVHCETIEAYENLDEILKIPEIDVIFLGPFDMSTSLGIPQQFTHPKMKEIISEVARKTKLANKIPGIYAGTSEDAKMRVAQGYQYITVGSFEAMVAQNMKQLINQIKE